MLPFLRSIRERRNIWQRHYETPKIAVYVHAPTDDKDEFIIKLTPDIKPIHKSKKFRRFLITFFILVFVALILHPTIYIRTISYLPDSLSSNIETWSTYTFTRPRKLHYAKGRCQVSSYHEWTPLSPKSDRRIAERKMLAWRKSFWSKGWRPTILNRTLVVQHPFYDQYIQKVSTFPTVNANDFELSSYVRWLAHIVAGGGLFMDYDIYDFASTFDPLVNQLRNCENYDSAPIISYVNQFPRVSHGNPEAFERWIQYIYRYKVTENDKWMTEDGISHPHISDMIIADKWLKMRAHFQEEGLTLPIEDQIFEIKDWIKWAHYAPWLSMPGQGFEETLHSPTHWLSRHMQINFLFTRDTRVLDLKIGEISISPWGLELAARFGRCHEHRQPPNPSNYDENCFDSRILFEKWTVAHICSTINPNVERGKPYDMRDGLCTIKGLDEIPSNRDLFSDTDLDIAQYELRDDEEITKLTSDRGDQQQFIIAIVPHPLTVLKRMYALEIPDMEFDEYIMTRKKTDMPRDGMYKRILGEDLLDVIEQADTSPITGKLKGFFMTEEGLSDMISSTLTKKHELYDILDLPGRLSKKPNKYEPNPPSTGNGTLIREWISWEFGMDIPQMDELPSILNLLKSVNETEKILWESNISDDDTSLTIIEQRFPREMELWRHLSQREKVRIDDLVEYISSEGIAFSAGSHEGPDDGIDN